MYTTYEIMKIKGDYNDWSDNDCINSPFITTCYAELIAKRKLFLI